LKGKNDELIKELVALSTKHGILTPYTSFLADDTATIQELAQAQQGAGRANRIATENLRQLDEADGIAGFAQRAEKNALRGTMRPAAPSVPFGGGAGGARYRAIDSDEEQSVATVRQLGKETVYRRGQLWIASNAVDIDPEKDSDKIVTVERYTEAYFELCRLNSAGENFLLSQQQKGEELLVKLRGQVYRIR